MTAPLCRSCRKPLPAKSPGGLCPACLMQAGLEHADASEAAFAPTIDHVSVGVGKPTELPEPGARFGGYLILRTLGQGGMGAVYEADQLETGRRVALKVLKHSLDSPEARKRFLREGRLAASINHPNSVYVYGTEDIDGAPAIAMELVAGGTLQERVKREGPLPIAESADIILQIIAGLEAAQKLGVLHRDIKPANCFVDLDGKVKVGDFGLSISTAARGDTDVTQSGAFLGTPAFSSPEQLRGDELNVRSDMYSVGVTLYYLLTGRTPFEAKTAVNLMAAVLEKSPESPRKYRPTIPQGLANVVLRCLEKQPTDRFKDYAELRKALQPFASKAPTPATLGLRFAAAVIDGLILTMLLQIVSFVTAWGDLDRMIDANEQRSLPHVLARLLTYLIYFGIPEGLWGLSPGKALCRVRVVNLEGESAGVPRAMLRCLIVCLFLDSPAWVSWWFDAGERNLVVVWIAQFFSWAAIGLLFSTARRSNGYSGVHDLATGTRVIAREAFQARPALAVDNTVVEPNTESPRIGPYYVLQNAESADGWVFAYDTRLLRRIWIRRVPAGTPPVDATLRGLGRIGRLRWLTGRRSAEENWDAYEAPGGRSLLNLLEEKPRWKYVRFWLLDLAEELASAAKDGSRPKRLAVDRIWITEDGRAKLLDFPAPGTEGSQAGKEPSSQTDAQFLSRVAVCMLEGRADEDVEPRVPAVPLPLGARAFLESLPQQSDPQSIVRSLAELIRGPAEVSSGRRWALLAGCCLPAIVGGFMGLFVALASRHYQTKFPELGPLMTQSMMHEFLENRELPSGKITRDELTAYEQVFAHRFRPVIEDPQQWNSKYARNAIQPHVRKRAERILAAHPQVSEEEAAAGEAVRLKYGGRMGDDALKSMTTAFMNLFVFVFVIGWLIWMVIASLLAALIARGGMLLWALGTAVVRENGARASRGRVFWRALICWSPVIAVPFLAALVFPALAKGTTSPGDAFTSLGIMGLMYGGFYLTLVFFSALMPVRGITDRLAGTYLVPR